MSFLCSSFIYFHLTCCVWACCKIAVSAALLGVYWQQAQHHHGMLILVYVILICVQSCLESLLHALWAIITVQTDDDTEQVDVMISIASVIIDLVLSIGSACYGIIAISICRLYLHHFIALTIWSCIWAGIGLIYLCCVVLFVLGCGTMRLCKPQNSNIFIPSADN